MDISPEDLAAEYDRALQQWPWIHEVEIAHALPYQTLYGVGSRETNLTNEVGDGGHGHGVWQLDDRSHTIPPGFDSDVQAQAQVAASQLAELLVATGQNYAHACAAYNEGLSAEQYNDAHGNYDAGTAHGDYGLDVSERTAWLQQNRPQQQTGATSMRFVQNNLTPPQTYLVTDGDGSLHGPVTDEERVQAAAVYGIPSAIAGTFTQGQLKIADALGRRPGPQ